MVILRSFANSCNVEVLLRSLRFTISVTGLFFIERDAGGSQTGRNDDNHKKRASYNRAKPHYTTPFSSMSQDRGIGLVSR